MDETLRLRADRVDWRVVEGEVVALDVTTSDYLAVTGAGTVIWEGLAEGVRRDELVDRVVARYEVDPATAAADVDAFVAGLDARGLVER